jgi:mono/diheme cytochrome c family protein
MGIVEPLVVGKPRRLIVAVGLLAVAIAGGPLPARVVAQEANATFTSPNRFAPRDGEVLYRTSCQACHMAQGEGAEGAGMYPPLAANAKLRTARYPAGVVVRGLRGMPQFGSLMTDEQIAAVVNYVRTHFGNNYQDALTAADVKALRAAR